MHWHKVAFLGDILFAPYGRKAAGINIIDPKSSRHSGRLQLAPIDDKEVIQFLKACRSARPNASTIVSDFFYTP